MTNDIDMLISLIRKFTKSCTITKYICMRGFFAVIVISSDDETDDIWLGHRSPRTSTPKNNDDADDAADHEFTGKIILNAKRLLD